MMCKAIERLSQGVKDGNGDEYAKDLSRLVHVTSRSSIYPEMRELVMDAFDGDKQEFVRPKPSLIHLFREWDSISDFIRAGGVGDLLIGGLSYRMDDFRLMVSLINCGVYKGDENFNAESGLPAKSELCYPEIHSRNLMLLVDRFDDQSPDLKAKVDRSALAGKNVGGCVNGNGEGDKRANTCGNKIVDNSKGKLTNVESSGTAGNKWNKKGSTSASKGTWNTSAEEETWGSVGEVSSTETGYFARNCSLGAVGSKWSRQWKYWKGT